MKSRRLKGGQMTSTVPESPINLQTILFGTYVIYQLYRLYVVYDIHGISIGGGLAAGFLAGWALLFFVRWATTQAKTGLQTGIIAFFIYIAFPILVLDLLFLFGLFIYTAFFI